ncbi:NAD(P)/FAD-dependent oxidoreductase [Pelagibacterium montanilacus]|uniref:NAD(P)/FAD-dependent oxidoreductase n=1 Tax=Pelagibacterium montanilacus TaxID=2185280 RepID=UPI000F8F20B7|nr:NAD(P)/FAD-dependent oxidoreductase [Pelagibacterium montanilacus]
MDHDVVIIGGSFAGLAAATYLARARKRVCVIDGGAPRNRFATHAHGFLGSDGVAPDAILERGRTQLRAYPGVAEITGHAQGAGPIKGGFSVSLGTGETISARALVLAFGISDHLPEIDGLAARWGQSVIHCPYCHGFEFADGRLGVLASSPMSFHQAKLIPEWGPTTLFLNGQPAPEGEVFSDLEARGVVIEPGRVVGLEGEGTALDAVLLDDGRRIGLDALYVGPRYSLNSDIANQLGCALEDGPLGPILVTDQFRQTSVPGVFAAGDITRGAHSVTWACADGVNAGTAAHRMMVFGPW